MSIREFLIPAVVAMALFGSHFVALGAEEEIEKCDEKGPCCDRDWTGQGATIVKIVGEGLVSQSPWGPATLGMRLRNGARVMVPESGTAVKNAVVVAYDDGCWWTVNENEILTIGDVSPCCGEPAPPPPAAPAAANWWPLVIPPVVCLIACGDGDNDDISP